MTLSNVRAVSGLSALATATGSAVNWKESLGTKSRATNLPLAVTGYECSGTLGVPGDALTLDLATGSGSVTGTGAAAYLEMTLSGGWGLRFTAAEAGYGGNAITVAFSSGVVASAATTVTVTGKAILVTRAAKARMVVTGTLSPNCAGTYVYGGESNGKPYYTAAGGYSIAWDGSAWYLGNTGMFYSAQDVATPDLVTAWVAVGGAAGIPAVTAGSTSASQAVAAIAASVAASALVTAHVDAGGSGYGQLLAMAPTHLAHGVSGSTLQGTDGKTIEGDPLSELEAICGIEIACSAGGLQIGCEGVLQGVRLGPGGVFLHVSPPGEVDLLANDLTIAATELNTAFSATVLGTVA